MPNLIEIYQTYDQNTAQQSLSGQGLGGVGGAAVVFNTYTPVAPQYGAGNIAIVQGTKYDGAGRTYNGQGTGANLVSPPRIPNGYQGHYWL